MQVPNEYHNREQTYLKHRVLKYYLDAWGHKLGSNARRGPVKLWYVDCFAGPWESKADALADTSISIGLTALEDAARTWSAAGYQLEVGAVFVEPKSDAFERLRQFLAGRQSSVETHPYHGEFGAFVQTIGKQIGAQPAFLFVDPTGWKGAAMKFIKPLMGKQRDVLVNVMFNHVNRFKDDPREFLREQMREFFGIGDEALPPNLDEESLLGLYRSQLKQVCGVKLAADLAVPHPTQDRTWFRLVVGGNHSAAIELFRDIERKVVGAEAGPVREEAARRKREQQTGQVEFGLSSSNPDRRFDDLRAKGLQAIAHEVLALVGAGSEGIKFGDVWPILLEHLHVTRSDVAREAVALHRAGKLIIIGLGAGERTAKDRHTLTPSAKP